VGGRKAGNEMDTTGLLSMVTESRLLSQTHWVALAGDQVIKHSLRMPFRGHGLSPHGLCNVTTVSVQTCDTFLLFRAELVLWLWPDSFCSQ